ncbi:MAG: aldo/keto reductase [Opitutaceae bacterium]
MKDSEIFKKIDRRDFILKLIKSSAALSFGLTGLSGAPISLKSSDRLGQLLPTRPFGNTSERLTSLCMGGFHLAEDGDPKNAQALIEAALEEGIRFFDTANQYHDGVSENFMGEYLTPKYREDVFIMSKCNSKKPKVPPQEQLDQTLKRLKTDYIDLWMVHAMHTPKDAERRINEMLPIFEKAKASGKVRYFGVSGHFSAKTHLKALEVLNEGQIQASLMPMGAVDFVSRDSFVQGVVPKLVERKISPLAMKTMNYGHAWTKNIKGKKLIPDRLSIEENQWFVLSLPISSWVSGMTTVDQVRQNADIVRRFTQLSEGDRLAIADKVMDVANIKALQPYRQWET